MRIVLSGPPSVGKSTQGKALANWLDVPHISSGALIRQQAAAGDQRAQRLFEAVSDGSLAPSDEICAMVMARLEQPDCQAGFILDGFPRKAIEAETLINNLDGYMLDAFVVLKATAHSLITRVAMRSLQSSFVRADDDPAVFPNRIAVYESETVRVREVMASHSVAILSVDAEGDPASVQDGIRLALAPFHNECIDTDQIRLAV